MMGASHGGGGVGAGAFGVDGFVRGFSFDAQPLIAFSLSFGAAPAGVRSPEISRCVGVAATLSFSLVSLDSLGIPIGVGLVLALSLTFCF